VFNFNQEAYAGLESFERWAKTELAKSMLCMRMKPESMSAASATGCTVPQIAQ
jgi:hypothetical protein